MDLKTTLRQVRAAMVAEFALKQRFERIEWEENVMHPELARIEREAVTSHELPEITVNGYSSQKAKA